MTRGFPNDYICVTADTYATARIRDT
jgi:hypothetical protein